MINPKLPGIAAFGAIVTTAMAYMYENALSKTMLSNPQCLKIVEEVNNHEGSKEFLGEPIEPFKVRLRKSNTLAEIFVTGPKSKGIIFAEVENSDPSNVKVSSIQLQIGADDTRRLVIK